MPQFDSIVTVTLNPAIDRVMRIDGFSVGSHQKGETLARVPAGKGVNVSRSLSHLGVASIAVGLIGSGQTDEYEDSLRGSLVRSEFLAVDGHTRENVTVIDTIANTETHLRDVGMAVTESDLGRLRNKVNLLAKPGGLVVFSGSLPPGITVERIVELIDIVLAKGAHVAVDGPADLLCGVTDRPLWLVKPNLEELLGMVAMGRAGDGSGDPSTETPDTAIVRRLARDRFKTTQVIMVSSGASGGYLFTAGDALKGSVTFDAGRVRSTVGCGDCLLAAFIARWHNGDMPADCFRYALAAATAASTGTDPGFLDPHLIDGTLPSVSIADL